MHQNIIPQADPYFDRRSIKKITITRSQPVFSFQDFDVHKEIVLKIMHHELVLDTLNLRKNFGCVGQSSIFLTSS